MAKTIEEKADNKYYLQNALENVFLLQGDRIKSAKKKAILEIQSGRMDWALIMLDNCIFRTRAEANAEWQEKTRWKEVEITPKSFPMYLNFKVGKCILCKKVDSLIEYYNLERAYRFTHWREIIE